MSRKNLALELCLRRPPKIYNEDLYAFAVWEDLAPGRSPSILSGFQSIVAKLRIDKSLKFCSFSRSPPKA
jgi:hypothetical protein